MRYIVSLSKSIGVDKNLLKLANALGSRDKVHLSQFNSLSALIPKKLE